MTDIFLSYNEPNFAFAEKLKRDVEKYTALTVALENEDWEEEDGNFQGSLDQTKMLLILATEHSGITAWVMTQNIEKQYEPCRKRRSRFNEKISMPPTIDFEESYLEGIEIFMQVLRSCTGHRFYKKKEGSTPAKQNMSSSTSSLASTVRTSCSSSSSSRSNCESPPQEMNLFGLVGQKFLGLLRVLDAKSEETSLEANKRVQTAIHAV